MNREISVKKYYPYTMHANCLDHKTKSQLKN